VEADPVAPSVTGRRVAVTVVLAVVAVAVALTLRWLTDLREFSPSGATNIVPVVVGQTAYADTGLEPRTRPLDIRSIHVRVATNTAGARVRIVVCRGGLVGAGRSDARARPALSEFCPTLSAFRSGSISIDYDRKVQLLYAVTPAHAGIVRISGVEIHFASGPRTGVQRAGARAVVPVH
jgi:hypothetical protein